jgi:molybdopterin synthase sulfur carrier subunit
MRYRALYFASLRDAAGCDAEQIDSTHTDARALYAELRGRHGIALPAERVRIAINGEFAAWDSALSDGDEVAFLPPVSGG